MERLSADLDRLKMGDAGAAVGGFGDEGIVCAMPKLNALKRDLPVLGWVRASAGACSIEAFGGRRTKGSTPVLTTEDYDRVSTNMGFVVMLMYIHSFPSAEQ